MKITLPDINFKDVTLEGETALVAVQVDETCEMKMQFIQGTPNSEASYAMLIGIMHFICETWVKSEHSFDSHPITKVCQKFLITLKEEHQKMDERENERENVIIH